MSYYDVFQSRVKFYGRTMAERIQNVEMRNFENQLKNSPHRVDLSTESGVEFPAIIVRNKDDVSKKIMELHTRVNTPIHTGDIINWNETVPLTGENGVTTEEKWILYRKLRKVNEAYQTYYMIRCNYYIRWVDNDGHVQGSWCYFASSLDNKVKENFRTWNSLITPQPNKYAEMIMPTHSIMRHTNFIVEDEGWQMVESDFSSVPGVMYLSLTETKVNMIYDDLVYDIADTDKIAVYGFNYPTSGQKFSVGSVVKPQITMLKNNKVVDLPITYKPYDLSYINENFEAIKEGETFIIVVAPDNYQELIPIVITADQTQDMYLTGDLVIKLNRTKQYVLKNAEGEVEFSIDSDRAKVIEAHDNLCVIKANDENKLGYFTLTAKSGSQVYTLEIKVEPLW